MFTSIYKLQQSKKLSSARFFGKILGTGKDYYVVEAKYVDEPERPEPEEGAPPPPVPLEASSEGCNTFSYFVTNDPAQEWMELPQVKPDEISAAMLIRKLFTGDLEADVRAYPHFPGKEKEYLRAQIVRPHPSTHPTPADSPSPSSAISPHHTATRGDPRLSVRGAHARATCEPSRHRRAQARIWTASTLCPKNKFNLDPEDPGELPFGTALGSKVGWIGSSAPRLDASDATPGTPHSTAPFCGQA